MKKVLIIGMTDILGGVETYIYNLIKFIDKNKFEFSFLVIGLDTHSVYENEINEMINDGQNHFFYAPNLKENYMRSKKWLQNFYDIHKFDIIYMNTCTAARIEYCAYAINKLDAKLITHSHNGNATSKLKGLNNYLFKHYTTKHSTKKLACSEKAYEWIFDDLPTSDSIIPNGIDIMRFRFSEQERQKLRNRFNVSPNTIILGHVGRFSKQKNHKFFIELCKRLDDRYMFLCIGDGEEKKNFECAIKDNNLQKKFIILDVQNDVEKYYSAMDILAMPSLYEGLPIVAIEAQCSGLPCVLSDKVSTQTNISGRCDFVSIENIDSWIESLRNINLIRYDGGKIIDKKGFSVQNTARLISNILEHL